MKKLTWQQWTAIGITAAVIITGIVLHLVQPAVSYAWLEAVATGTFVLGGVTGWLLKKNNIINKTDKTDKK